jgi:hypothetical protein
VGFSGIASHPLIDEILEEHRDWSEGHDAGWAGYRNHAQRVFVFARQLVEPRPDAAEKMAIAAAFHDLAVFRTVDYLIPNLDAMEAWLHAHGRAEWHREIGLAMTLHHRVRRYRGDAAWLVEPMRRADWVECTLGVMPSGIPRGLVRRSQRAFPMGRDFISYAAMQIATHAITHPLNPLPFWRSRTALQRLG